MISEPAKYVESLAKAGANQMSVHYEADLGSFLLDSKISLGNIEELSQLIKKNGMLASLALNPKTMIDHTLIEIFDKNLFDMILVMTVGNIEIFITYKLILKEPGLGG